MSPTDIDPSDIDPSDIDPSDIDAAIARASDEFGLQDWYRACVKPLLRTPRSGWPMCCGGGCEPCNQTLVSVADRALTLLKREPGPGLLP